MNRHHQRYLARIAVLFLLLFVSACSPAPANPTDEALKGLAGKWKITSMERDGKPSTTKDLDDMEWSVEGDKLQFTETAGAPLMAPGGVTVRNVARDEYILQVNPAVRGEIDFVYSTGKNTGKSRLGMYQLEGGTLKISLAAEGKPRPGQIAPGAGIMYVELERQAQPQP